MLFVRFWILFLVYLSVMGVSWWHDLLGDVYAKGGPIVCVIVVLFFSGVLQSGYAIMSGASPGSFVQFCARLSTVFGMLGTTIGFAMAFQSFENLSIDDHTSVNAVISDVGYGVNVALYTTIVGIISNIVLRIHERMLMGGVDDEEA